uniref:BESS domain-containing protein n=1 Tax=Heliothis virescens TaxID=7102 RepID=A0A2A4JID6_HELVI
MLQGREYKSLHFTTMQFEYDPERLIEEVRKRPGIWNYDDAEYRAKNMRYKLWNEVVTELLQTDIKVSKSEMRELEIQLQKKWKSIRDCFQKYISNPNRTKKPYIYCRHLQFLLKDQELPHKDDEGTSDSEESKPIKKKRVWRSKKKLKLVKDEETSEEDNDNTFDVTPDDSREHSMDAAETSRPAKQAKVTKPEIDEFAFANVDAQIKSESDDPDKMFLLSLLPHLKTIPEEFRLNVKMELMQVLRNANYNSVREHKLI